MAIREALEKALPDILPRAPGKILGTKLIPMAKAAGVTGSDAAIRYALTQMSKDPTSCLAKVEFGNGYYLREVDTAQVQLERISSATDELTERVGCAWKQSAEMLRAIHAHRATIEALRTVLGVIETDLAEAKAIAGDCCADTEPGASCDMCGKHWEGAQ